MCGRTATLETGDLKGQRHMEAASGKATPASQNVLETLAGSSSRGAATGSEQKGPHPASVQCTSAALAVAQRDREEGHRDVL